VLPQLNLSTVYTRQAESFLRSGPGVPPFAPDTTASLDQRVSDLEEALPGSGFYALDQLFSSSAFASQNAWGIVLSLEQKLFQGGSLWGSVAAAQHALRASELNEADTREEIAYQVRLAYLDALLAERTVRIFELGLEQGENHLQQVRLRQEAGAVSQFDLLQAEVERDNQIPPLRKARESRARSARPGRLYSLPSAGPIVLTDPFLGDVAVPAEPSGWIRSE
jgi:outer membrane protein TolC